jgi:hypothetical protein
MTRPALLVLTAALSSVRLRGLASLKIDRFDNVVVAGRTSGGCSPGAAAYGLAALSSKI